MDEKSSEGHRERRVVLWKGGNEAFHVNEPHGADGGAHLQGRMMEDKQRSRFGQAGGRIWAQNHADAPAAGTGGLLEAEEDHRRQVREGRHQGAQVAARAHVVGRAGFFDDVIIARRTVVLAPPRPCWRKGPQRRRTLAAHGARPDAICRKAEGFERN